MYIISWGWLILDSNDNLKYNNNNLDLDQWIHHRISYIITWIIAYYFIKKKREKKVI